MVKESKKTASQLTRNLYFIGQNYPESWDGTSTKQCVCVGVCLWDCLIIKCIYILSFQYVFPQSPYSKTDHLSPPNLTALNTPPSLIQPDNNSLDDNVWRQRFDMFITFDVGLFPIHTSKFIHDRKAASGSRRPVDKSCYIFKNEKRRRCECDSCTWNTDIKHRTEVAQDQFYDLWGPFP